MLPSNDILADPAASCWFRQFWISKTISREIKMIPNSRFGHQSDRNFGLSVRSVIVVSCVAVTHAPAVANIRFRARATVVHLPRRRPDVNAYRNLFYTKQFIFPFITPPHLREIYHQWLTPSRSYVRSYSPNGLCSWVSIL